ncbi:LPS export ABC transporter periplasmic protein LptC [Kamptonema formosum]|uniref:LPS export ABC transporter periplasmic protein LptC n=1 Tax=Kamptonema formosum TaxID=331992 RepID=UPI0003494A03|nr:LPS export ABC transporter periplasmic protein LptC [Oscillatoria sp. PCC 10802]
MTGLNDSSSALKVKSKKSKEKNTKNSFFCPPPTPSRTEKNSGGAGGRGEWPFYFFLVGALLLGSSACSNKPGPTAQPSPAQLPPESGRLTLKDITLVAADEKGQLLWKVKAMAANYTKDQAVAHVENPDGELFQDGKLVFRLKAKRGEVHQDGKKLFLFDDIVATDIQDGAVLRGDQLEWRPKEDILTVRKNLTGTHKQVTVSAQEGRMKSRQRHMELTGTVVATSTDPPLQLRTEHVVWERDRELVTADVPVQIDRYEGKTLKNRATAGRGEVSLKAKTATLQQNARVNLLDPPVLVASESMTWDLNAETVRSEVPVTVVHESEQLTFSANQGIVDIKPKICYLTGSVRGAGERRQSRMSADLMTWNISTQDIDAEGNVVYNQADPPLTLNGPKAVGNLNAQTVTVTGGGEPVVTEIVPEEKRGQ